MHAHSFSAMRDELLAGNFTSIDPRHRSINIIFKHDFILIQMM